MVKARVKIPRNERAEGGNESEKTITLYRGVHAGHPDYHNALQGMAVPGGGDATETVCSVKQFKKGIIQKFRKLH